MINKLPASPIRLATKVALFYHVTQDKPDDIKASAAVHPQAPVLALFWQS